MLRKNESLSPRESMMGNCPFCGASGCVGDVSEWCGHLAGTFDHMMNSAPVDLLTDDEFFDDFRQFIEALREMSDDERADVCNNLEKDLAAFLLSAAENPEELFWLGLVQAQEIHAVCSESLSETTYVNVFVRNGGAEIDKLKEITSQILQSG